MNWWLVVLGCGTPATTGAAVPTVALPSVPSAVLRIPEAVEVVVSPAGIYVDPRPWYAAVPSERLRPIGPGLVLALAGWEPTRPFPHELAVPHLPEILEKIAGEAAPPPVLVRAAPDAPTGLVRRVIFSAYMAGLPAVDLAVAGAGDRALRLPHPLTPPCGPEVPSSGECLFPVVVQIAGGWTVSGEASSRVAPRCAAPLLPSAQAPWFGRQLVASAGVCGADTAAVASLLARVPGCGGEVVVLPETPWQEAIDALVAFRADGRYPDAVLGVARRPSPDCASAFVVP